MKNKVCCAFGHRKIFMNVDEVLQKIIDQLITQMNVSTFLTGGMGKFDDLFSAAIRRKKKEYPHLQLVLILPYHSSKLNKQKDYYETRFDSIIIPEELMGIHYKSAIKMRNRWMIEQSDYVLGYVYRDFGGAHEAMKYAAKQKKILFNIAT